MTDIFSAQIALRCYQKMREKLPSLRKLLGRPLTLAEKLLLLHLSEIPAFKPVPTQSMLPLLPDRVVMQDATAQMALLQFAQAKLERAMVPATVHCDHLIRACKGADQDLKLAQKENKEVFEFLASACQKYGIGFWKPGSGVIHQIFLENYAFPGGLAVGSDSHTPNAGGLGMLAVGVGGADTVEVMAGLTWELKYPELIGVRLTGELHGWTSAKDVILYLCGLLTTKGGTNKIIEYFGPGTRSLSCTGKATIANMGAEVGATSSIFPYDGRMEAYLQATGRSAVAEIAGQYRDLLTPDPEIETDPGRYYNRVIEINLSTLEPYIVGPHTPDLARPISQFAQEVRTKDYPEKISAALVGSCTNSSYEDLNRAKEISLQAHAAGLHMSIPLLVGPGSEEILQTARRDGQIKAFEDIGATILANACGPCIGQWQREDTKKGVKNSILTTFNRNFAARNDGNPETLAFIASPEIVIAMALASRLSFNPLVDPIELPGGKKLKFLPPTHGSDIPPDGFADYRAGYAPPAENGSNVPLAIDPHSQRLQLLDPFPAWKEQDFLDLPILLKVKGKCTTDHISPAGPWLKYRGHLDRISDNLFSGASNAFTGSIGNGKNQLTGEPGIPLAQVARAYKSVGLHWAVIAEDNYGEGSSREHAAMSPRHLGGAIIMAKSFARIHETNLKKQGLVPLVFVDPANYDTIQETDRISISGTLNLRPGDHVIAKIVHSNGETQDIALQHSFSAEQIKWFQAGSALNYLRLKNEI